MSYDFCFSNPEIADWFDGKTEEAPIKHLQYLHTHPLVKPNFITEVEASILQCGQDIVSMKLTSKPLQDLSNEAVSYAKALSKYVEEPSSGAALECLHSLRRLRKITSHVASLRRK